MSYTRYLDINIHGNVILQVSSESTNYSTRSSTEVVSGMESVRRLEGEG